MDHSCQQCGAEVEQGTPFCPKCNAPQIRVSVPMPEPERERTGHEDSTASALPGTGIGAHHGMDWRFARSRAAIAAAAFLLVTLFVPVLAFFFISMPLCGLMAVYLYRKGRTGAVSIGTGVRIGLTAGTFAFILLALLGTGQAAYSHYVQHHSVMADMQDQLEKTVNANPNPQAREMGKAFLTPDGVKILIFFGICLTFGMFLVLCGIGGAVAAVLLARSDKT